MFSLFFACVRACLLAWQVPTDSQVRTIVWITVFGNVFFVVRAAVELFLAATFIAEFRRYRMGGGR